MPSMDITYIFLAYWIFLNIGFNSSLSNKDIPNRKEYEHECLRECEYPPKPRTCEYVFVVEWTNTISANCFDCPFNQDDCYLEGCVPTDGEARPIIVTNGKMPGPSIQVCQWDTIRVKVINNLQDHTGLSIHWHGMYQNGTNWMDGASMITQCPIAFSSSFVYKFTADPPGTHWWHGHSGYQRSDGLYGALIVRKPKVIEDISDEYDEDLPEHVVMITDWRNPAGMFTTVQLSSVPLYSYIGSPEPTPLLVNGRARGDAFLDGDLNEFFTPTLTFEVIEGLRYRFRIISSAYGYCNMQMSIEGHPLTVVSLDGSDVQPKTVDSIIIAAGESYDIVMTANAKGSSYCMYFYGLPDTQCSGNGTIILRYKNRIEDDEGFTCNPKSVPASPAVLTNASIFSLMDTQSLDPVDPALYIVDAKFYLLLDLLVSTTYTEDGNITAQRVHNQIDHVSFIYQASPFLTPDPVNFTICEANKYRSDYIHCAADICKCTSLLKVEIGQVVEFIIIGRDPHGLKHSMHIHGHDFRVLAQELYQTNHLTVDDMKSLDEQGLLPRLSPDKATVKDTVLVPDYGYVIIRWKADNPGYWFFHCHSEAHLETGMGLVVQVGDHIEIPLPPTNFPRCGPWPPG